MIKTEFHPNPFYDGGTLVFEDEASGRRQHMPIRDDMTRTEFLRLARFHIRRVLVPHPAIIAGGARPSRIKLAYSGDRRLNGGRWTE